MHKDTEGEPVPVYQSRATRQSMGQVYRVYSDRIELPFRMLFTTYRIPLHSISAIDVVPPCFSRQPKWLHRKYSRMAWFWCLVLDWAAFNPHVILARDHGGLRYFHFTPDDPDAFVSTCRDLLTADN